eukprot:11116758-Lingulodinium_polyedra.AAC.1
MLKDVKAPAMAPAMAPRHLGIDTPRNRLRHSTTDSIHSADTPRRQCTDVTTGSVSGPPPSRLCVSRRELPTWTARTAATWHLSAVGSVRAAASSCELRAKLEPLEP